MTDREGPLKRAIFLRVTVMAIGLTIGVASGETVAAQGVQNPARNALAGARLFGTKGCSDCHSVEGPGGDIGIDLRDTRLKTFYELAADMWNHLPQMSLSMDSVGMERPHLDPWEIGDIIAFLYSSHYFDQPGDSAAGAGFFRAKNCIRCHQAGGIGGVVGRNLDYFGRLGSPIEIAAAMWNNGTEMAAAMEERGIPRASFSGTELIDLIAYIRSVSTGVPPNGAAFVLPGTAEQGRLLFAEKACDRCHRVDGVGGGWVGPDLAEQRRHRSLTEFAAAMWNKAPSMWREMSRMDVDVPQLEPAEMADIVAYLYSVRYFRESGNPDNGRRRIRDKGCLGCHSLDGAGASSASELSQTSGLGSPQSVIAALWNHVVVGPESEGAPGVDWPAIQADEMADIVAFFQRISQE